MGSILGRSSAHWARMQLTIRPQNRTLPVASGQSVLDAALAAHINLPHSCKGGSCGSCHARLLQGQIHYPRGRPPGLSEEEAARGFALLCQARALTDLVVDAREVRRVTDVEIRSLPCRVERLPPAAAGGLRGGGGAA